MTLRIKEPDVKVPKGLDPGEFRRIIQPFENWTLICDENLRDKTRICNVTQTIIDQTNRVVFSSSIAATRGGQPFMIIRTLPGLDEKATITLDVPDGKGLLHISLDGCTESVCVGKVPVGPRLRPQIDRGNSIRFSYSTPDKHTVSVLIPLKGINDAVSAIR
ncbi:invasion associated locus B family protein [Agrobacterium larrymoorei]